MNNKEAIRRLKDHFRVHDDGRLTPFLDTAVLMAYEALEKQIPKAVKYNNRHGSGYDFYNRDYFNCPACGRRLRNKQKDPYCGRCGQAIDWGDFIDE